LNQRHRRLLFCGFVGTDSISVPSCKIGLKLPIAFDVSLLATPTGSSPLANLEKI
jgi:hypothetical protein